MFLALSSRERCFSHLGQNATLVEQPAICPVSICGPKWLKEVFPNISTKEGKEKMESVDRSKLGISKQH
jgi:hypothetical protein